MCLPNINEVRQLSMDEISREIIAMKRQLFELRLKKATRQSFKPHLFKHTKHRLAQLFMIEQNKKLSK